MNRNSYPLSVYLLGLIQKSLIGRKKKTQLFTTNLINDNLIRICATEKTVVMDLIRSAVGSQSDYYQREVRPEYVEEGQVTKLPPINETGQIVGGGEKADR